MLLLEFDDVSARLDKMLASAPFDVDAMRLTTPGLAAEEIRRVEGGLGLMLPMQFKRVVSTYDVGGVSLGGVHFAADYADYLLDENSGDAGDFRWWQPNAKPDHHILVGDSDGYAILLDTVTDRISAFRHGGEPQRPIVIARDFEMFLRAAGTLSLQNLSDRSLVEQVTRTVGAEGPQFWDEFASGVT